MARRKKNQIFEKQHDAPAAEIPVDEQPASPPPEMYGDMDKEDFPSRVEELEELDCDRIEADEELQKTSLQLLHAQQRIQQLEDEIKQLKADNDTLLMKLAELASSQVERAEQPKPTVKIDPECHDAASARPRIPKQTPFSKNVNYKHDIYRNNGYGTWH